MKRIVAHLEEGKPVRTLELEEDEEKLVKSYFLLTSNLFFMQLMYLKMI